MALGVVHFQKKAAVPVAAATITINSFAMLRLVLSAYSHYCHCSNHNNQMEGLSSPVEGSASAELKCFACFPWCVCALNLSGVLQYLLISNCPINLIISSND